MNSIGRTRSASRATPTPSRSRSDPHGNDRLSGDRAGAVLFFLEDHGFDLRRHPDTAFQGFGSIEPLVPNDPAAGAGPRNRRVEVVVQRINYLKRPRRRRWGRPVDAGAAPSRGRRRAPGDRARSCLRSQP